MPPLDCRSVTGLSSWLNFFKSLAATGVVLGTAAWATVTFALDGMYAPASLVQEVGELKVSVHHIRTLQIKSAVPTTQATACGANGSAKGAYEQQVRELVHEYEMLTGAELYVPSCEDLLY